jgi:hypothetical protein
MDGSNVALELGGRQDFHGAANFSEAPCRETSLTQADCRLLLISSLTLFLRRARHGFPVTSADLLRLASYGDPADSPSAMSAANGVAA